MNRIVVIGASLAGAHAVHTLRRRGFDGELVFVGTEPHAPYDRPPLSKNVLAGSRPLDSVGLRFLRKIEFIPRYGTQAMALDAQARTVQLADGETLAFDGAVIATGSTPVRLDPELFPGVCELRTVDDSASLADRLRTSSGPLVVLGAGLIGCEVAATARGLGVEVILVDPLLPCERVLGSQMAELLRTMHTEQGVVVHSGERAVGSRRQGDRTVVRTDSGREIAAGTVLVAVGAQPETGWLGTSGLTLDDGVVCDEACRAAPGIVAAGDVARWQHPRGPVRLEHWNNAVEQGRHAARTLLADLVGEPTEPYLPMPWFWTDQYEHTIQVAGWVGVGDTTELHVVDGDPAELRFFAEYRDGAGTPQAAVGIDSAAQFNAWLVDPERQPAEVS